MRFRARRNPSELLIVNPRPRFGPPQTMRRSFRRPSLARPVFERPNPGHKAVRPKARPVAKRPAKATKKLAREPTRSAKRSAMAIKKRRKRSKRKAGKVARRLKRSHRKARKSGRKVRRHRKARRNPSKRRKRRKSRKNPLIMRGRAKNAKFSWLGRTKTGKRKRRAKPISKASARRRVKRGEVVLVKRGRGWAQASPKSVASALLRRTKKAKRKARKAARKARKATSGIRHVESARANPRRRRKARHARRNPRRKHRRSAGRKHSRLHAAMSMRRNPSIKGVLADLKALAPQMLGAVAGLAVTNMAVSKAKDKVGEWLGKIPAVGMHLQPHAPAITAALVTAGVYAAVSMIPQLAKVKGGVAIGGAVVTGLLLAQSTGLTSKLPAGLLPGLSGTRMGASGGILGDYTTVGEYTSIGDYTTVGGMDDRSPMALMGMDDASVFAEDSLRGMDDAAPFAPGEGGVLAGGMFR